MTKTCSKCKRVLDVECFDKNPRTTDGYNNWCKICKRNYYYEHYKKTKAPEIKIPKEGFKYCQKCNIEKPLTDFSKNGQYGYCRECSKLYYQENKEKLTIYFGKYNKSDAHRQAVQKYRKEHKEQELQLQRTKYQNNLDMRINRSISGGIWSCIKGNKANRHWEDLVDFTLEELKEHLESQFTPEMNWDNYGKYGWHIDHIIPKRSLFYTSPNDLNFKICWHLSNLRPLWYLENLSRPKDGKDINLTVLKQQIIDDIKRKESKLDDKNALSETTGSSCNFSCSFK